MDFISNDIEHTGEFYIFLGKGDGGFVEMPTFSTGLIDIEEVKFGGLDIGRAQDLIIKRHGFYYGYIAKWDGGFHPEDHRLWQSTTLHPEYFHLKDLNNDGLVDRFVALVGDSSRSAVNLGDYGQADSAPQCPDNAFCWGVFLTDNGHQSADLISAIQTRHGAGIEMTYKPSYQYPGNHFPLTVETLETLSINEWAAYDAPTTARTIYTFSYANGL
ncbi:MAG: hypothetical protein GY859_39500, partial [Desulfobacterales bacterium]|nr:hypothetical protein [Desulfobacterales bacterium]